MEGEETTEHSKHTEKISGDQSEEALTRNQ